MKKLPFAIAVLALAGCKNQTPPRKTDLAQANNAGAAAEEIKPFFFHTRPKPYIYKMPGETPTGRKRSSPHQQPPLN